MTVKIVLRRSIYLLLFISCSSLSFAQQKASVSGMVTDADNKIILVGADVLIQPLKRGAATDQQGDYRIDNIDPGTYTLEVSFLGYRKYSRRITLSAGENMKLNVSLHQTYFELGEVVFKDWAQKHVPYVKSELTKIDIEATAAFDIGEYLRNVPNVSAIRKGGTQLDPVIRGFKYDQLNVRIDGYMRIEGGCPNRMDPNVAHVEIDDIERIEVLKGPYALLYGPVGGGVLLIHTTKPTPFPTKKFELTARGIKSYESSWNGTKERLNVKFGNNRIYFNLSGNNQDYGSYRDGNGKTVPSYFRKYSFKADAGFRPKENHEFIYSFVSSQGRDVKFLVLPMDERVDDTRLNSIIYTITKPSDKISKIVFNAYNSNVYHEMDNKEKPIGDTVMAIAALDAIVNYVDGTLYMNGSKDAKLAIRQSFEHTTKEGNRERIMYKQMLLPNKTIPKIVDPLFWARFYNIGTAAEYEKKLNLTSLTAAVRFDYNASAMDSIFRKNPMGVNLDTMASHSGSDINLSASFGLNHYLNEKLTLSFALGRGVRSASLLEKYVNKLAVGYDRYDYLGNPDLKPEANHQIDLTLKYETAKFGRFTLNGFFSAVTNYIAAKQVSPTLHKPVSAGVLGVKQFYNADLALFRGFEFTYVTPFDQNFGASVIASYTRATLPEAWDKMATIKNDPMPEIPPFEARLQMHYKMLNNRIVPRINIRYVAAQDYISVAYNENSSPSFWLADMGLTYQHNEILSLSGGVRNLFDRAYYEHLNRRMVTGGNFYEPGRVLFISLIAKI